MAKEQGERSEIDHPECGSKACYGSAGIVRAGSGCKDYGA